MPLDRAKGLCWMTQTLADLLAGAELEDRLDAVEAAMRDGS